MRAALLLVAFSAITCTAFDPVQQAPDGWLLAVHWSSGGPAPIIDPVFVYSDGRLMTPSPTDLSVLREARLHPAESKKLSAMLESEQLSNAVAALDLDYRSGCCDMADVVLSGAVRAEIPCDTNKPIPPELIELLDFVRSVVTRHFGPEPSGSVGCMQRLTGAA